MVVPVGALVGHLLVADLSFRVLFADWDLSPELQEPKG